MGGQLHIRLTSPWTIEEHMTEVPNARKTGQCGHRVGETASLSAAGWRSGERYELLQRVRNTLDSVSSSQQFPELHVDG